MRHYIVIGLLLLATMAMAEPQYGGTGGFVKSDRDTLNSSIALSRQIQDTIHDVDEEVDHIHNLMNRAQRMYPTIGAGIAVIGSAGAWAALPATYTTVVDSNVIASEFVIRGINIGNISANETVYIEFYYGPSRTFCGSVRATKNPTAAAFGWYPISSFELPANTKITARASGSGAATTTLSIGYTFTSPQ